MKLINLGKFNNFTNLKSSAIRGWFPLLINHDSRVRTGFGRYNLPRSISRDTSWFFWSGLHISCHMSMTGNKQIMLSPLEKNPQLYPYLGVQPTWRRWVIPLYVYIYTYGIIIHEYPLYYIWDDIYYMGFVWIINHLLRLNSWYLAIQSPHLETARDVIRRIPLHAILAFFGFVSNGQAIGPKNAPMGRLRPGAGIEGEQAGRAKAEDRNLARRSRSMFDAFRIRHASGLHGSSWFIISYITLYI